MSDNLCEFTYIDLFAGCGGLSLGLHHAGWKGLFAIEKSKDAFSTLKHNLIDKTNHFDWPSWLRKSSHDINSVLKNHQEDLQKLKGKVDLVAGGPPCQGFSMAGRRNAKDKRNKLIESYIEFVKLIQPKLIFFENVKGFTLKFKKNENKNYSSYVKNEIAKLGYDVRGELVDFSEYGVPQKRVRYILVASKQNNALSFFENIKKKKKDFLKQKNLNPTPTLSEAISDLLKSHGTVDCPDRNKFKAGLYSKANSKYQEYMREGIVANGKPADSHSFAKHSEPIVNKFSFILNNDFARNKNINEDIKKFFESKKNSIYLLSPDMPSPTLTTLPDDYIHYYEPRILTAREYARIQSFPDSFELTSKYTTGGKRRKAEVPRYTQIGNAIPPLFAEQSGLILKEMT